jgi:aspartate/methionine/tyrosine aminotransferase
MFFTILALLQPGDEAIYPDPGFPIYRSMINFVGAVPVPLPLREVNQFRFDQDEFRSLVNDRTRLIIINTPQNPTGGVLTRADLEVIADTVRERNITVLSDEVYEQIIYEGKHTSILSFPGMRSKTVLLDGFSKTYAMTGWRLGYGVMPEPLAAQIEKLMVNSNSCTAAFTQLAGLAALTGSGAAIAKMVASFRKRRQVIVTGLNEIPGFRCTEPAGAFYAFANVDRTGLDSKTVETLLLNEAGVASLDGGGFGQFGRGYIRFSYANSTENLRTALSRIRQLVEAW